MGYGKQYAGQGTYKTHGGGGSAAGRAAAMDVLRQAERFGQASFKRGGGRSGYSTVPRTVGVYGKGEMKYFDLSVNATNLAASADWTATEFDPSGSGLFHPTVGSAINQRIGREVKVYKIKINGTLSVPAQANQTAGDAANFIRLLLVQDTQTNSTQMQGEQLMDPGTGGSAYNATLGFQSLANFGRFRVLKDKTYTVQNPNSFWDGTNIEVNGLQKPFKFTITFKKPVSVRFNATNGGSIADIVDNSFHVLCNTNSTSLAPAIIYNSRVCYKE